MINLDDKQFEEKEINVFNNGEAGVVKDCAVRIEKKTADDKENAPDYKLVVTDPNGGEVNKGYYRDFNDRSEGFLTFFVKEMKHLAKVFRVDDQQPKQVGSYEELLDVTMKICNKNQANVKVNVAVCYGNIDRPQQYLNIDGFWGIKNTEDGVPQLSNKALTVRPVPDDDTEIQVGNNNENDGPVDPNDWA